MTFPQTDTGHGLQNWPQSDHICQFKRGFHCNCPTKDFALAVSFQTTPFPVSAFWVSFFPSCFSPFAGCLLCLLCSVWVVSDASELVKPKYETHTAPVFTQETVWRKTSMIKLPRHLHNSLHSLVYIEPAAQVTKSLLKCVRSLLVVILDHIQYYCIQRRMLTHIQIDRHVDLSTSAVPSVTETRTRWPLLSLRLWLGNFWIIIIVKLIYNWVIGWSEGYLTCWKSWFLQFGKSH